VKDFLLAEGIAPRSIEVVDLIAEDEADRDERRIEELQVLLKPPSYG